MPRQTYSAILEHTNDATFRVWGQQLSDALKACLTQTADTGQINWTTATRPTTNNFAGYEIYRFSDALQATKPVFIKVEYGTAASGATWPAIRVTVGTGTNGAGTLTGLVTVSSYPWSRNASPAAVPQTTWVCYKDGTFTLAWGLNTGGTNSCLAVMIDRSRNTDGTANGRGVLIVGGTQSSSVGVATTISYDRNLLGVGSTTGFFPCLVNASIETGASSHGAVVNLFNWYCFTPDINNIIGAFTYKNNEIPAFSEIDAALVGGTSRHYVTLGNACLLGTEASVSSQNSPAFLWEV